MDFEHHHKFMPCSKNTPNNGLYSRRPVPKHRAVESGPPDYRYHPYTSEHYEPIKSPIYRPPITDDNGLLLRAPIGPPPREYDNEPKRDLKIPSIKYPPPPPLRCKKPAMFKERPYVRRHDIHHGPLLPPYPIIPRKYLGLPELPKEPELPVDPDRALCRDFPILPRVKKIYTTNEEEYQNPQLALKYTKPYDTFEKFYQFVIDRPPNAFEQKIIKLMDEVFSQPGVRSKIIFMESEEGRPLQTLQGSIDCCKSTLVLDLNEDGEHVLSIDGEEICKGTFQNKQIAKNMLGEQALEILKRSCFYIIKKPDVYEDIDTDTKKTIKPGPRPSPFATPGSKAHTMMMKMGWAGKGLGVNEQGESRPVADIIDQNVTRRGLGTYNGRNKQSVYKEIANIFEEFKDSAKISVLRFAPDFDKEERAYIHNMALKAGLKSRSEGVAPNRRITITKKITRDELVHSLLLIGCESALYELLIPERFIHLWVNL